MFRTLIDKTNPIRRRLTRLDNQPLGRAALVVMIFLDIFILSTIFDGLSEHGRQLTAPDEHIPPICRDIVIDREWNATNRLDKLSGLVRAHEASRYLPTANQNDPERLHALCAPLVGAFHAVRDDAELARQLAEAGDLAREIGDLRAELDRMKGAYDTRLLEKIAGEDTPSATAGAIQQAMADRTATLNERVSRESRLLSSLEQAPKISRFFDQLAGVSEADRTRLSEELRRLNFWHPAKRLGMDLLFLLPLLAAFYFWNSRSLSGNRPFQALVSSHLLVVATIPVLFKVMELVYDILPRKLLAQVIAILESLRLIAIWHYLLIAVAIAGALFLIYVFQKRLFSHDKLMQRRIAKGQCHACGQVLPTGSRHCPSCGAGQFRDCRHCGQPTLTHGQYCTACGHEATPTETRP